MVNLEHNSTTQRIREILAEQERRRRIQARNEDAATGQRSAFRRVTRPSKSD